MVANGYSFCQVDARVCVCGSTDAAIKEFRGKQHVNKIEIVSEFLPNTPNHHTAHSFTQR